MKCFYHQETEAVGLCYYCNRGLCAECAMEYTRGLACRNRCERHVVLLLSSSGERRRRIRSGLKIRQYLQPRRELSLFTQLWVVMSLFAALLVAMGFTHEFVKPAPMRMFVEFGIGGSMLTLLILAYLLNRQRVGSDR